MVSNPTESEEQLTDVPNAVGQRVDEVLDSSCDGASVAADLSDVVHHGCNDKLRLESDRKIVQGELPELKATEI